MQGFNAEFGRMHLEKLLLERGYRHLEASSRGSNIYLCDASAASKSKLAKFTHEGSGDYRMSVADKNGLWLAAQLEGTLKELLDALNECFPWVLADFSNDER
jgi:hypothetical protein